VDVVNSVYAINDFLAQGWDGSNNEIDLVTKTVEPRGDEKELAEITDLIGSYTTNFASSSAGRAKNVITGVSKVDGTILYPGEEFDLAKTVSPFTQENGYELAGAYQNGTVVESFGGGICQVATTLYNAVIRAELEITMRFNHSMLVHYVEPSMMRQLPEIIKI
jgi:vancomycin resistance protein YoaR